MATAACAAGFDARRMVVALRAQMQNSY